MRKSKEPLGYLTFKLSDRDYAQLATQATVLNITMGELLRVMIRRLPVVDADIVMRWAKHRKQSGHDRQHLSLEEVERRLEASKEGDSSMTTFEREYLEVSREEIRKELAHTKPADTRTAFEILGGSVEDFAAYEPAKRAQVTQEMTAIEKAELEEKLETQIAEGSKEAKKALEELQQSYKKKEVTEL